MPAEPSGTKAAKSARVRKAPHAECGPVNCDLCGKSIARKSDLNRHKATHDPNAERFNCTLCNYSTLQRSNLKSHENSKHGLNQSPPPVQQHTFKVASQKPPKRKRDDADKVASSSSSKVELVDEANVSNPRRIPLRVVRTIKDASDSPSEALGQFSLFSANPYPASGIMDADRSFSNAPPTPSSSTDVNVHSMYGATPFFEFSQNEMGKMQPGEFVGGLPSPYSWTGSQVEYHGDADCNLDYSSTGPCDPIEADKLADGRLPQHDPIRLHPGHSATGNLACACQSCSPFLYPTPAPSPQEFSEPSFAVYGTNVGQGYLPPTNCTDSMQEYLQLPQISCTPSSTLAFCDEYDDAPIAMDWIDVRAFHFTHELPELLAQFNGVQPLPEPQVMEEQSFVNAPEVFDASASSPWQFNDYDFSSLQWDGSMAAFA